MKRGNLPEPRPQEPSDDVFVGGDPGQSLFVQLPVYRLLEALRHASPSGGLSILEAAHSFREWKLVAARVDGVSCVRIEGKKGDGTWKR